MNNFNDIVSFLEGREQEIEAMFLLCDSCKVKETVLLKSSIVLLAYNTVEGCYDRLNREIFSFIEGNNIPINLLNAKLQSVYYRYHKNSIHDIHELKAFYENKKITAVSYDEISKKVTLFSGNLDAREIRSFCQKQIGINIRPSSYGKKLVYIKNLRNKLAHGEVTFQDALKDKTLREIREWCDDGIKFMEIVISAYEEFYVNELTSL